MFEGQKDRKSSGMFKCNFYFTGVSVLSMRKANVQLPIRTVKSFEWADRKEAVRRILSQQRDYIPNHMLISLRSRLYTKPA